MFLELGSLAIVNRTTLIQILVFKEYNRKNKAFCQESNPNPTPRKHIFITNQPHGVCLLIKEPNIYINENCIVKLQFSCCNNQVKLNIYN